MRLFVSFIFAFSLSSSIWAQEIPVPPSPPTTPPITLEAKVVQIVLNDEHRDGVDWEAIVSDFHSLQLRRIVISRGRTRNTT